MHQIVEDNREEIITFWNFLNHRYSQIDNAEVWRIGSTTFPSFIAKPGRCLTSVQIAEWTYH